MAELKHLPIDCWPLADRIAWAAAFAEGDVFDESQGPGAHLSVGSRRLITFAYRRWLGFLSVQCPALLRRPSRERIAPNVLRKYVEALQAEGAATTTAIAVQGLYRAARLIAPAQDWAWLRRLCSALAAQAQPRDRFERLAPPWQILDLGLNMMEAARASAEGTPETRRQYRDGLLLALLALWPIRRRSLAALTVGRHVERRGDRLHLRLFPEDTKAARSEYYSPHEVLVPHLERYLLEVRPRFRRASEHDGFWASDRGRPLTDAQLYDIVRRRTEAAFGRPMALHDMRRAAATYVAIDAPEKVGLIPGILQHASPDVGEQHYNLARSSAASRRFNAHVSATRKRLNAKHRV